MPSPQQLLLTFDYLVAVLITGGKNLNSTELFLPSSGTSYTCTIPLLPETRYYHTVDNNILCGGDETRNSCLKWSPNTGSWADLLTLSDIRTKHVSWTPGPGMGTYLMGGWGKSMSTTLIKEDGTQEPAFKLEYNTQ